MYLLSRSVDAVYPQSTLAKDGYRNVTLKYANTKRNSVTKLFSTQTDTYCSRLPNHECAEHRIVPAEEN